MKIEKILDEDIMSEIELDYYTPISIEYRENDVEGEELFYYRLLNKDSSFIEFKINSKTNKIFSIILVSINGLVDYEDKKANYSNIYIEKGNPIISDDSWHNGSIVTSHSDFYIMYNANKLFLLPQDKKTVAKIIEMPNAELVLDAEGKVVGCIFIDLPSKGKKDLEACINRFF